ncbi:hypothetical protein Pth03_70860 [Planotetraspora thailandica]|uniref:Uncharacterized protein n=1 Tax=Planotetraspora thailandica TaxID=487172 RepID=A0A8J4DF13_9ACTN|nr:hypothetical protein [Planotetraspora thailandica]GII58697.1 hypothetical protein Pth03_70860 [Planotetraspora thailandica]
MDGRTGRTGSIYTVEWVPGTDLLLGICHCGARRRFEDPIELWDWMLGHPEGHRSPADPAPEPALTRRA